MECDSEFQALANHNAFVADLEAQGYHLDFKNAYFIIYGVPYLDRNGELKYGDLASPVDLDNWKLDAPSNHQVWFKGERPCNIHGVEIRLGGGEHKLQITDEFVSNFSFSFKLNDNKGQARTYTSFKEKIETYLDAIVAPAMEKYPEATPLRGIEVKAVEQGTSLRYPDSMSARYEVNDVAFRLKGKRVAIIGLGGTGSYILDFLSKTHLDKIVLYDDDKIHVHTIFRIPGFIHRGIGRQKVDALAEYYGQIHGGIEPHSERVGATNLESLLIYDFVFVAVDCPNARGEIVAYLADNDISYVDCGMGLSRSVGGLNGMVRVTGTDARAFACTVGTPFLPTTRSADDEYRRQPQIAELNALNAAFAVMRFKQHFGMYELLDDFASAIFETASFEISYAGYQE